MFGVRANEANAVIFKLLNRFFLILLDILLVY